jgi:hypothetical protein
VNRSVAAQRGYAACGAGRGRENQGQENRDDDQRESPERRSASARHDDYAQTMVDAATAHEEFPQ